VFGGQNSSSYSGITATFSFPTYSDRPYPRTQISGFRICRRDICRTCHHSPEGIAIHVECFIIFTSESPLRRYEAISRLWTMALYRNAWSRIPPLRLERHEPAINRDILARVAHIIGLPELYELLPLEVVAIVRRQDPHLLFWRTINVITAAHEMIHPLQPLQVFTLTQIKDWHRGMEVDRSSVETQSAVFQLRLDTQGISEIKRFPQKSSVPIIHTKNRQAWTYVSWEQASIIQVHFQVGERDILYGKLC